MVTAPATTVEPLLQWRWAHSELAYIASSSEIEVVITQPGSVGFGIVMSPTGCPVISGFASSHDKGALQLSPE